MVKEANIEAIDTAAEEATDDKVAVEADVGI